MALATGGRRRRRRLTLAPRSSTSLSLEESSGSRYTCLRSDSEGSEADVDSVPVNVALRALDEEVRADVDWTPVISRRRKSGMETVNDFWREIGYPTPLSRPWSKLIGQDRRQVSRHCFAGQLTSTWRRMARAGRWTSRQSEILLR
jgi:hypothetical protein